LDGSPVDFPVILKKVGLLYLVVESRTHFKKRGVTEKPNE